MIIIYFFLHLIHRVCFRLEPFDFFTIDKFIVQLNEETMNQLTGTTKREGTVIEVDCAAVWKAIHWLVMSTDQLWTRSINWLSTKSFGKFAEQRLLVIVQPDLTIEFRHNSNEVLSRSTSVWQRSFNK